MTACKEMAVIDGDKSKNTNLVYFASMFFPIQQFTWLQAHWLFALLYLKLTQSLQSEQHKNYLKPTTLTALNVTIQLMNVAVACLYWVKTIIMGTAEVPDCCTQPIKTSQKYAKYAFFAMEFIIAVIWVIAVTMLKKGLDNKYQKVNLDIKKFFLHSFVFTL